MFGDDLGQNPTDVSHLVRYGQPKPKIGWSRPMGYWQSYGKKNSMARQLYRDIKEPFFTEAAHPFDNSGLEGVKDFWQAAREAVTGAAELFKAREERMLTAEQAKIAEAQARGVAPEPISPVWKYWPVILGAGGIALILTFAAKKAMR